MSEDDATPQYSDAELNAAFDAVVDNTRYYETPGQREAFVDGAMALHMLLQQGTLPSKFALSKTDE